MDEDLRRELTGCRLRTRARSPFFSVLISYLKVVQVDNDSPIETAAVDGRNLFVNKDFFLGLSPPERDFVLSHEAMHCALGHCWRIGGRQRLRWNFAADFVVNLILEKAGFTVGCSNKFMANMLLDHLYDGRSTEEVYDMLQGQVITVNCWQDVLDAVGEGTPEGDAVKRAWEQAKARAQEVDKQYGNSAGGQWLKVQVEPTNQDWRAILWRELSNDRSDFEEWDNRLVGDEIYVERLDSSPDKLRCAICMDTSGSTVHVLGKFVGIIQHIVGLYREVEVDFYFADAELIGPVPLSEAGQPQGGGGTSFVPFFKKVEEDGKYDKALYLTDLYGEFPNWVPKIKTIWAVAPGGGHDVPFGEIVRIVG